MKRISGIILAAGLPALFCFAAEAAKPVQAPPQSELQKAKDAAALGSEARALDIAMAGLRAAPDDRELFLYAVELLPEKRSPQADALAETARAGLAKQSGDYAWHLGLCKTRRASGDLAAALASCKKALELDPAVYPPYRELGLTYAASGSQAKAVETLAQGAEIVPSDFNPHYQLARALEKAGNSAGAKKQYNTARILAVKESGLEAGYHKALAAAGLKRLDQRTEAARNLPDPPKPDKKKLYALCLGRFRDAVQKDALLDASDISAGCIKLAPGDPELAAELAPVLVRLGKYEKAVGQYERAAGLYGGKRPEYAYLRIKAAETWVKLGSPVKAIAQYRLALQAAPSDINALKGLADLLEARSDFKAALETYEAILKLEPANAKARVRAEELKASFLTNDEIMAELRLRRVLDDKTLVLQPSDIKLFKSIRAAEMNGAVEYLKEKVPSMAGLSFEHETPGGTRVLLTDAGYKAYLASATRDAIKLFEKQKVDLREVFKLRNKSGEPVFDKSGQLSQEGVDVWRAGLSGEKNWLLSYEAVQGSPQAVQANKDIAEASTQGYREISEPEYLWLGRATNCPEDVLKAAPLSMKLISDGARVRYMMCYVPNAMCSNPVNEKLVPYIADYRSGKTAISDSKTSTNFFGSGGVKKYRFCEKGRIWDGSI